VVPEKEGPATPIPTLITGYNPEPVLSTSHVQFLVFLSFVTFCPEPFLRTPALISLHFQHAIQKYANNIGKNVLLVMRNIM
jgi:hypothetical protein